MSEDDAPQLTASDLMRKHLFSTQQLVGVCLTKAERTGQLWHGNTCRQCVNEKELSGMVAERNKNKSDLGSDIWIERRDS